MFVKVRENTFETNSSSVHAFTVYVNKPKRFFDKLIKETTVGHFIDAGYLSENYEPLRSNRVLLIPTDSFGSVIFPLFHEKYDINTSTIKRLINSVQMMFDLPWVDDKEFVLATDSYLFSKNGVVITNNVIGKLEKVTPNQFIEEFFLKPVVVDSDTERDEAFVSPSITLSEFPTKFSELDANRKFTGKEVINGKLLFSQFLTNFGLAHRFIKKSVVDSPKKMYEELKSIIGSAEDQHLNWFIKTYSNYKTEFPVFFAFVNQGRIVSPTETALAEIVQISKSLQNILSEVNLPSETLRIENGRVIVYRGPYLVIAGSELTSYVDFITEDMVKYVKKLGLGDDAILYSYARGEI